MGDLSTWATSHPETTHTHTHTHRCGHGLSVVMKARGVYAPGWIDDHGNHLPVTGVIVRDKKAGGANDRVRTNKGFENVKILHSFNICETWDMSSSTSYLKHPPFET